MKTIHNNKGIALITALMITFICLVMVMAILYVVTQGIKTGGAQKVYHSTIEAAYGGVDVMAFDLMPEIQNRFLGDNIDAAAESSESANLLGVATDNGALGLQFIGGDSCLKQKLTKPSSAWTACTANATSIAPADIRNAPDIRFDLRGTANSQFRVYTKIVETLSPVSDVAITTKPITQTGGTTPVLTAGGGAISLATGDNTEFGKPIIYRIEVLVEKSTNPLERSHLSVLYEW